MREPRESTNDADRGKSLDGATEGQEGIGGVSSFGGHVAYSSKIGCPRIGRTTLERSYSPRVLPTSRLTGNPNLGRSFRVNVKTRATSFLPAPLFCRFKPSAATQLLRSR
jgi:hypothetical protein